MMEVTALDLSVVPERHHQLPDLLTVQCLNVVFQLAFPEVNAVSGALVCLIVSIKSAESDPCGHMLVRRDFQSAFKFLVD
jgi:hypothetical protein